MRYIDADKLIAEIKRRKIQHEIDYGAGDETEFHRIVEDDAILKCIDSLRQEQPKVDLEKEMKETIEVAEEHAMLAGRIQMEEEMKKKAIEGTLDGNHLILHYSDLAEVLPRGKSGDRVKAIIVKIDDGN